MEWVETTAKTLEEAKDLALDRLGVAADEAEFEILEEPKAGLFGRLRGEARVRARVRPNPVRPKVDRRSRGRNQRDGRSKADQSGSAGAGTSDDAAAGRNERPAARPTKSAPKPKAERTERPRPKQQKEQSVETDHESRSDVSPDEVGAAAATFMTGLAAALGTTASTEVVVDGSEIEVRVTGPDLGLLVGHGGRTLTAVQDLARVASQRRLGDHDTRLRLDIGGYREKRKVALERFARTVAQEVLDSGRSKALEPMQSADRKIVHDTLMEFEGVTSRSEGDDPFRRVVISPA